MIQERYDPIHPDIPSVPSTDDSKDMTTNYKLLLNKEGTITSWLNIFNTNMEKIDTVMHNLVLRTSIDGTVPPEAIEDIIKLNAEVATLKTNLDVCTQTITEHDEIITNLNERTATQGTSIDTLRNNYIALDTRMTAAESRLAAAESELTKLATNINSLVNRVAILESR